MIKYTILYKNGKSWNGKAENVSDIKTPIDALALVYKLNGSIFASVPYEAWLENKWDSPKYLGSYTTTPKRVYNPASKTKKQVKFDGAFEEWACFNYGMPPFFGAAGRSEAVKAYKKHLYEQKLANSSKFSPPPSPGDMIGYYPPGSDEIKWLTIKEKGPSDVASNNWIPWNGGDCPVPIGTMIWVKHRDGDVYKDSAGVGYSEDWEHTDDDGDIIAYKLYKESTYTFWLGQEGE